MSEIKLEDKDITDAVQKLLRDFFAKYENHDDYIRDITFVLYTEIVELMVDLNMPTDAMKAYIDYMEKEINESKAISD